MRNVSSGLYGVHDRQATQIELSSSWKRLRRWLERISWRTLTFSPDLARCVTIFRFWSGRADAKRTHNMRFVCFVVCCDLWLGAYLGVVHICQFGIWTTEKRIRKRISLWTCPVQAAFRETELVIGFLWHKLESTLTAVFTSFYCFEHFSQHARYECNIFELRIWFSIRLSRITVVWHYFYFRVKFFCLCFLRFCKSDPATAAAKLRVVTWIPLQIN